MKFQRHPLLLITGAALLGTGWLLASNGARIYTAQPSEEAFARALKRSASKAQAKLEASTRLWQDHSTWDDAWVVDGESFAVRTTHSMVLAREVLEGQETMRAHFDKLLEGEVHTGPVCPIFLFPDRAAYNAFGDEHGEHHSSILGGFYATAHPEQPIATYVDESRTRMQMWITHNSLHDYLTKNFPATPPVWIDEGLASYFALFWDFEYGIRELEALKSSQRLLSFEQLLSEDLSAYTRDPHARFIQLGMMFTYLLRFNEDTRRLEGEAQPMAPFDEYLRAVVRKKPTEELPFALYLDEETEAIVAGFLRCTFR